MCVTWWNIFITCAIVLTRRVVFVHTEMSGEARSSSRHVRTQHLASYHPHPALTDTLSTQKRLHRPAVLDKPSDTSGRVGCVLSHRPVACTGSCSGQAQQVEGFIKPCREQEGDAEQWLQPELRRDHGWGVFWIRAGWSLCCCSLLWLLCTVTSVECSVSACSSHCRTLHARQNKHPLCLAL